MASAHTARRVWIGRDRDLDLSRRPADARENVMTVFIATTVWSGPNLTVYNNCVTISLGVIQFKAFDRLKNPPNIGHGF